MSTRANRYFLPGDEIAREVITADICRYLGNDALVKPGDHQGRRGYWITAYRALTSDMIADLKADSARWQAEREQAGRSRGSNAPVPYTTSRTHEYRQFYGPTGSQTPQFSQSSGYPTNPMYGDARDRPQQPSYDPFHPPPQSGQGYPQGYPSSAPYSSTEGYPTQYQFTQGSDFNPVSTQDPRNQSNVQYTHPDQAPTQYPSGDGGHGYHGHGQGPPFPSGGGLTRHPPREPYGRSGADPYNR